MKRSGSSFPCWGYNDRYCSKPSDFSNTNAGFKEFLKAFYPRQGEIYETMKPKAGVMTQLIAEVVRNGGMY